MHHLPSRYIPCDGRLTASAYFDPRSPHRERLPRIGGQIPGHRFQSTLPVGGATEPQFIIDSYIEIFQSTLSVGGDPRKFIIEGTIVNFNPHSPHGERQISESELTQLETFQSTLPAWGATVQSKHTAMTA